VCEFKNKIIGAVWVRIIAGEIKGYENIDNLTPEFVISVTKEFRRKGIGMNLMSKMIYFLKQKGYSQASLSVQKNNYAVKMYQKIGFSIISENKEDFTYNVRVCNVYVKA